MANWKYSLDFKEQRELYEAGKIDIAELGKRMAEIIRSAPFYKAEEANLGLIARALETVQTVKTFDRILDVLYDWGDEEVASSVTMMKNRRCWVGLI
jgi:hypothetical protein